MNKPSTESKPPQIEVGKRGVQPKQVWQDYDWACVDVNTFRPEAK